MTTIAKNFAEIRSHIGNATLIAVTKTRGLDDIHELLALGQRAFGESRVQEAAQKFPGLRQEFPDLELHLIGPLQTNKVAKAVEIFDVIQTLDRRALADALAAIVQKGARLPRLSIEVNIGRETQKAGVAPEDLDGFLDYCRTACSLPITGLMCIPPQGIPARPFFAALRALADRRDLTHVSMGMSEDYRDAIACGASEVRIGTALFAS